jgi:ribosomal protein S18 acetylase RimI-like enzyme
MIEAYWNEMFGEFKVGDREFSLPEFPEPLMSPHFGVRNIVGPAKNPLSTFYLCHFPQVKGEVSLRVESLDAAINKEEFWGFQKSSDAHKYLFMRRLLPFLVENKKPHFHIYQTSNEEIVSSAVVGITPNRAFLFNLYVHESCRKQGLAKLTLDTARAISGQETFYWTIHPWFTLGAPEVLHYHIVNPS